jgi:hypothetical protein
MRVNGRDYRISLKTQYQEMGLPYADRGNDLGSGVAFEGGGLHRGGRVLQGGAEKPGGYGVRGYAAAA